MEKCAVLRRLRAGRGPAAVQSGDGRAVGAVDLEGEQVVAPHPRRPGREDGADGAALQLDQGRGVVLDVDLVALAALVDALRRRGRHRGDDAPHRARACSRSRSASADTYRGSARRRRPCGSSSSAAGRRTSVPSNTHQPNSMRKPVDAAEEIRRRRARQLLQAGQAELVLDRAVLEPARLHRAQQAQAPCRPTAPPASRNRCACRPRSPFPASPWRWLVAAASKKTVKAGSASAVSRSVVHSAP